MFEIVEGVLAEARAQGLREVEVYAERSRSTRIKVFRREVEQLTAAERRGVGVRVFRGGAVGHASTSVLHPDALSEVVRRAAANASIADADEFAALPEPAGPPAEVETFDERFAATTNAQRIEVALELEAAALAADPRVKMAEDAVYADEEGEVFLANSAGVRGSYRSTSCSVFAYVLAEADEQVETGFSFSFGRAPADLRVEACGREAAERACRLLGARSCPSLAVPVVLDPFVAADLFGVIGSALTGDAMQKGRSLFAGREGQRVAAEFLSLEDDGARAGGLSSIPFDDEGVPAQRTALIHDGVLRGALYDTRSARRAGLRSTGNGLRGSYAGLPGVRPTNLVVGGPTTPLEALLREVGRGVLVTDAVGVHSGVNPVSGEFSVGIAGVLIEDGHLTTPIHEVTLAGDLLEMLKNVRLLGDDARWMPGGSILTPSVVIDGMTIGGS